VSRIDTKTVVITWRDGRVATYRHATTSDVNGTLHVYLYDEHGNGPLETWRFPSAFIRAIGPEPWAPDPGSPGPEPSEPV
jgi:hypothetical protein